MKRFIIFCFVVVFLAGANLAQAEDWSFQEDKQLHLVGGAIEGIAFQTLYEFFIEKNYQGVTPWKRHLYAFGLTFATGTFFNVVKEATDITFSTSDLSYGTSGLITGATATIFVFHFTGDFKNWK